MAKNSKMINFFVVVYMKTMKKFLKKREKNGQ